MNLLDTKRRDTQRPGSGNYGPVLGAASLVSSVAIAFAIETGWVSWSWWWLVLTGAPFALGMLALAFGLVAIAISRRGRRRR